MFHLRKAGLLALLIFSVSGVWAQGEGDESSPTQEYSSSLINIRNSNGKLYAYIQLLYMENQHFVNMIQEDSIPQKLMQTDNFNVRAYKNYILSIKSQPISQIATSMLDLYLYPGHYSHKEVDDLVRTLESRNIILRVSANQTSAGRSMLDYCILGQRSLVNIKHPLFEINEKIYNIRPLIYYDEFSTSNSTFYFDMIYINPEEVQNDYIIANSVLHNKNVETMFFVGAKITEDTKACLRKAFTNTPDIKTEIWKMFEIHELTHKILNNHYNFFDQVVGEEMALSSTIYANPYLGLAVLYSYLDYNATNPHRIAALNYLRFVAMETSNRKIIDDPSQARLLSEQELLRLTKLHFTSMKRVLK